MKSKLILLLILSVVLSYFLICPLGQKQLASLRGSIENQPRKIAAGMSSVEASVDKTKVVKKVNKKGDVIQDGFGAVHALGPGGMNVVRKAFIKHKLREVEKVSDLNEEQLATVKNIFLDEWSAKKDLFGKDNQEEIETRLRDILGSDSFDALQEMQKESLAKEQKKQMEGRLQMLSKRLDLTEDQLPRVEQVLLKNDGETKKFIDEEFKNRPEGEPFNRKIMILKLEMASEKRRDSLDEELKRILNEEQFEKYLQAENKGKRNVKQMNPLGNI